MLGFALIGVVAAATITPWALLALPLLVYLQWRQTGSSLSSEAERERISTLS